MRGSELASGKPVGSTTRRAMAGLITRDRSLEAPATNQGPAGNGGAFSLAETRAVRIGHPIDQVEKINSRPLRPPVRVDRAYRKVLAFTLR